MKTLIYLILTTTILSLSTYANTPDLIPMLSAGELKKKGISFDESQKDAEAAKKLSAEALKTMGKDLPKAIETINEAWHKDNNSFEVTIATVKVLLQQAKGSKDHDIAEDYYDEAIDLAAKSLKLAKVTSEPEENLYISELILSETSANFSKLLLKSRKLNKGKRYLKLSYKWGASALKRQPDNADLLNTMAQIAYTLNRKRDAKKYTEKAVENGLTKLTPWQEKLLK